MNLPHAPPRFFEFKLAHWLIIIGLAGNALGWWLKHESTGSSTDTLQNQVIEQHNARFFQIEGRMQRVEDAQSKIVPDIREIKTKLDIVAELLDGEHKNPRLHDHQ